jgi:alanine racemase
METLSGPLLTIDLDAVCANYRLLKARGGGAGCAAVVKANAYGLGVDRVAPALAAAGCRSFFVATLDEGIALRRVLSEASIYVLNGLPAGAAGEFPAHRLVPVLNRLGEIEAWSALARSGGAGGDGAAPGAALHLDSGLNRLGLPGSEVATLAAEPGRLEGVAVDLVISHMACADEPDHPMNAEQLAAFVRLRAGLPAAPASLAASSAIFLGADYHFDLLRPGAALYGVNPTPGAPNPMAEVVRLAAPVLQVREVGEGDTVGYGGAHRMAAPGRIATLPVGYADGYFRALGQRGWAGVAGRRVPVVGRVSMDLITLDVTALAPGEVAPGTVVDLIGGAADGAPDVDQVAERAGTIGYEVLTALGRRYRRRYLGGAPSAPARAPLA